MPKSVMIVDDNELIRRNLRRLFRGNEDWVICAEAINGGDAIEQAEKFHPDFVVLDFSMPGMDGLEAAAKLKDINPNSPIVMLTAYKDRYLEQRAYKSGVTWVLSKSENVNKVLEFARILLRPDAPTGISKSG
jgi:DNA-binding NarL/FixJ family response regulator